MTPSHEDSSLVRVVVPAPAPPPEPPQLALVAVAPLPDAVLAWSIAARWLPRPFLNCVCVERNEECPPISLWRDAKSRMRSCQIDTESKPNQTGIQFFKMRVEGRTVEHDIFGVEVPRGVFFRKGFRGRSPDIFLRSCGFPGHCFGASYSQFVNPLCLLGCTLTQFGSMICISSSQLHVASLKSVCLSLVLLFCVRSPSLLSPFSPRSSAPQVQPLLCTRGWLRRSATPRTART